MNRYALLPWLAFIALLCGGLAVRWMSLTAPPLDFHATRQLRGVIIARGMYYQAAQDVDAERREIALSHWNAMERFEPPLLERLAARTYLLLGGETIWIARVYVSLIWLLGALGIYLLSARIASQGAALVATGYYLFTPFSVIASRSFQPDPIMVVGMVFAALGLTAWQENNSWKWAFLAGISSGLAILLKPFAALPVGAMLIVAVAGGPGIRRAIRDVKVWFIALLAVLPAAYYYLIPAGRGIAEGEATSYFSNWSLGLLHLLLKPSFYIQWLLKIDEVAGGSLFFIALVGVILTGKHRPLLGAWWFGYGLLGLLLPYLISTHNYYSLPLVPLVALSLVKPADLVLKQLVSQPWHWRLLAFGVVFLAIGFSAWQVRNHLKNQPGQELIQIWEEAGAALPTDGSSIALTQFYGYPLMVYGWQKVFLYPPIGEQQLSELRGSSPAAFTEVFESYTRGRSYFLVTDWEQLEQQPDLRDHLFSGFDVVVEGDDYILFALP